MKGDKDIFCFFTMQAIFLFFQNFFKNPFLFNIFLN